MSVLQLQIGPSRICFSATSSGDAALMEVSDHRILLSPRDLLALGEAVAFVLACISPASAQALMSYDPSRVEKRRSVQ